MKIFLYVVAVTRTDSHPTERHALSFRHAFVEALNERGAYAEGFRAVTLLPVEVRANDFVVEVAPLLAATEPATPRLMSA